MDQPNIPDAHRIIHGNSLEVLKTLSPESVDTVFCSPPYWGLRKYDCPTIYGGDSQCEHEWGELRTDRGRGEYGISEAAKKQGTSLGTLTDRPHGSVCLKCSAWRGELGLEPDPQQWLEHLWAIFDEVRRVLKSMGTCWINLGDTYGGSGGGLKERQPKWKQGKSNWPAKSLMMLPERFMLGMLDYRFRTVQVNWEVVRQLIQVQRDDLVGFQAVQDLALGIPEATGWLQVFPGNALRNKDIWAKRNAMPSSVKDRLSNRWEYVFMFSKARRYWFDLAAVRRPMAQSSIDRINHFVSSGERYDPDKHKGTAQSTSPMAALERLAQARGRVTEKRAGETVGGLLFEEPEHLAPARSKTADEGLFKTRKAYGAGTPWIHHGEGKSTLGEVYPLGANPGDVIDEQLWDDSDVLWLATQPRKEAHFATFPDRLVEFVIKAGCPEQVCSKCDKPRERIIHTDKQIQTSRRNDAPETTLRHYGGERWDSTRETIGWTSCDCGEPFLPGLILDPFAGRGTVCCVAKRLGRRSIGIELKEAYATMAKANIKAEPEPDRRVIDGY